MSQWINALWNTVRISHSDQFYNAQPPHSTEVYWCWISRCKMQPHILPVPPCGQYIHVSACVYKLLNYKTTDAWFKLQELLICREWVTSTQLIPLHITAIYAGVSLWSGIMWRWHRERSHAINWSQVYSPGLPEISCIWMRRLRQGVIESDIPSILTGRWLRFGCHE